MDGWRNEMGDLAMLLESQPPPARTDLDASVPRSTAR